MTELLDAKEAIVDIHCKQLKLPGLKAHFRDLARDAMTQNQTPISFLAASLAKEVEVRVQKTAKHSLKTIPNPRYKNNRRVRPLPASRRSQRTN